MAFFNSNFAVGSAVGASALTALFILSGAAVSCANNPTWAEQCIDKGGEYITAYDSTSDDGYTDKEECRLP